MTPDAAVHPRKTVREHAHTYPSDVDSLEGNHTAKQGAEEGREAVQTWLISGVNQHVNCPLPALRVVFIPARQQNAIESRRISFNMKGVMNSHTMRA